MSDMLTLNVEKRDENKNARQLREEGILPATIYGKGMTSVSVQLNCKDFILNYKKDPKASFKLVLGKDSYKAQVANLQQNYSTMENLNVEFKVV